MGEFEPSDYAYRALGLYVALSDADKRWLRGMLDIVDRDPPVDVGVKQRG